jgi:hypothetical protein
MQTESTLLVFEKVPTNGFTLDAVGTHIQRARIPGGWPVVLRDTGDITFVPDSKHEWDGGSVA